MNFSRVGIFFFVAITIVFANVVRVEAADHVLFTQVLSDHVTKGRVDYKSLKKDSRLDKYIHTMSAENSSSLKGAEQMAYWINMYNALTLKVVCDNFPVNSIMDIQGGQVWKKQKFSVGGTALTLEAIENQILRPLGDARIHFALVCAAVSCPPLRSEAYTASKLNAQLTDQARTFLSDRRVNNFDPTSKRASISRIFEWYSSDFGSNTEELAQYLSKYAPQEAAKSLTQNAKEWKMEFGTYDWKLND